FPDPDLVPVAPDRAWVERLRAEIPELPRDRRARQRETLGLSADDLSKLTNIGAVELVADTVEAGAPVDEARNWWLGYLNQQAGAAGVEVSELGVAPRDVARAVELVAAGSLSTALA